MAKLRTSFLTEEARLYGEEREQLFGTPIQDRVDVGERSAGFIKSLVQGFSVDGFGYARDQWRSLKDFVQDPESAQLTPERYEELRQDDFLGKIDVPFEAGITERQFRNRLAQHKRDQFMQSFERSGLGTGTRFLGAMGGGMLAPEVLGTIWVGGPALSAAARAKTGADLMRKSMVASTQISAAAVPANIVAQDATYGRVDPMETTLTAAAPYVFTPMGAAFSRVFTPREQRATASGATTEAPTPTERPADNYVPADFRDEFTNYEGGVERWVDDVAQNNETAIEYGRSIGLTDDAIGEIKQRTFVEASRTPLGREELLDLDALEAYAGNRDVSLDQISRLQRRGLVEEAETLRGAEETPDFARSIDQQLSLRSLNERRAEIEASFPEVVDALRYRDYIRAGAKTGTEATARPMTAVSRGQVIRTGGKPVPSTRVRQQAEQLQQAVAARDPSIAPENVRDIAEELIAVADVDRPTQRVAYRREADLLKITDDAARGDLKAQTKFAERMIQRLPSHAEADWKALRTNGIEGLRARFIERKIAEANELTARLGMMVEARRGRRGRPPKQMRQMEDNLRARLSEVEGLVENARASATRPPQQVTVDDIADILAASRFKRAEPGANEAARRNLSTRKSSVQTEKAPTDRIDSDEVTQTQLDEILAYAKQNGVDLDGTENSYMAASRAIVECQI